MIHTVYLFVLLISIISEKNHRRKRTINVFYQRQIIFPQTSHIICYTLKKNHEKKNFTAKKCLESMLEYDIQGQIR
jgi:hypothetical protein